MRRRCASFRAVLLLASSCWLAAGPGGVVMRAALACRQVAMHMHHGPTPNGGPCFCSQMVGAFDQVLAAALPPVEPVHHLMAAPVVPASHPSPFPLPPSPVFAPETPPPIVA